LEHHIDLDATRRRIAQQSDSALAVSRESIAQREAEVAKIERALATTERDYDAGDLTARQYSQREARLADELDGAKRALEQAGANAERIEQAAPVGDAEQQLLDHLAAVKKAVAEGIDGAPGLIALRNVIGELFESVALSRAGEVPSLVTTYEGDGMVWDRPEGSGYVLWPVLRGSVDPTTWEPVPREMPVPVGQETPVGCKPQYPPSVAKPFFARYCWW
jgi:hypothetical protein